MDRHICLCKTHIWDLYCYHAESDIVTVAGWSRLINRDQKLEQVHYAQTLSYGDDFLDVGYMWHITESIGRLWKSNSLFSRNWYSEILLLTIKPPGVHKLCWLRWLVTSCHHIFRRLQAIKTFLFNDIFLFLIILFSIKKAFLAIPMPLRIVVSHFMATI